MYTSTPADVPDPPFRFFEGLVPRLEQTRVAATRLAWTVVILDSSETSGPVGHLQCTLAVYIKSFWGQKGGSSEPPRTPPAYGPEINT